MAKRSEETNPQPVLPVPDLWSRPFWEFANRSQLALQQCHMCSRFRYPAAPICPECWSEEFSWEVVCGKGKVVAWVVFHQNYYPGSTFSPPYNVAMVTVDEGPTVICNLVDIEDSQIRVNLPVEATFSSVSEGTKILQFRPVPGGASNG